MTEKAIIPVDCKHRLSHPRSIKLELLEFQSGNYLDEDNIFVSKIFIVEEEILTEL